MLKITAKEKQFLFRKRIKSKFVPIKKHNVDDYVENKMVELVVKYNGVEMMNIKGKADFKGSSIIIKNKDTLYKIPMGMLDVNSVAYDEDKKRLLILADKFNFDFTLP